MFQRSLLIGACLAIANMQALAAPLPNYGESHNADNIPGLGHHLTPHYRHEGHALHNQGNVARSDSAADLPHGAALADHGSAHTAIDHGLWWEHDQPKKPDDTPKPASPTQIVPKQDAAPRPKDAHKIGDPQPSFRDHTLELDVTHKAMHHPDVALHDEGPQAHLDIQRHYGQDHHGADAHHGIYYSVDPTSLHGYDHH